MADMDTNAIAQALKDLDCTSVPVRNREAIERAIVALDRGDPNKLVANDAAAAPTDERVEAAAIAMHAIRRDLAKGVGDLSFDMAFDTLPDEIKEVDRALARAAILAAFPVEKHEAAPVGLGWRVREMRAPDGTLTDCFVEAPAEGDMAYGLQVLGDDYTGYGDIHRKREHCKMIVAWANAKPTPQHIFEYLNLLDRTEREVVEREARALTPAQSEPAVTDERATWDNARESLAIAMAGFASCSGSRDFNAAISVLDAITEPGLPLSWLRTARASSPNAALSSDWKPMPAKLTPKMREAMVTAAREYQGRTDGNSPDAMYEAAFAASSPDATGAEGARDTKEGRWCPDECPVTGKPFFMWIDHPELGYVPTYGGPYDSYTIAVPDQDGYFRSERYDHDEGSWVEGGAPMRVRRELVVAVDLDTAPALVAIPAGYALVPIERSYDMRAKALIAFNTTEHAGKDRDDALDAAHRATIAAAPQPSATSPSAEG
ncbi:hypothetical protein [Burkholderia vietnamiensis]|uniref:hypothetical protein n=1 Tax=Burkholderia vietnamiensis TaxID=60552 RepID=UPI001593E6FF|nr:hypothetical protein [Burkholderia vietnamiensis]